MKTVIACITVIFAAQLFDLDENQGLQLYQKSEYEYGSEHESYYTPESLRFLKKGSSSRSSSRSSSSSGSSRFYYSSSAYYRHRNYGEECSQSDLDECEDEDLTESECPCEEKQDAFATAMIIIGSIAGILVFYGLMYWAVQVDKGN